VLHGLPVLSVQELIERIDAVHLSDLQQLAAELYAPDALSLAGVGREVAIFLEAIEPLRDGAAASAAGAAREGGGASPEGAAAARESHGGSPGTAGAARPADGRGTA
jgi:hypothetical protein